MKEYPYYVGIDPGFTGALAVISPAREFIAVYDVPVDKKMFRKNNRKQRRVVFARPAMLDLLTKYKDGMVVLEDVAAMRGQGVTGMFRFGHGVGLWEGMCVALGMPYIQPHPLVWKGVCGLVGKEKVASLVLARKWFPTADLRLMKHNGRADALCMAEYGRQFVTNNKDV